MVSILFLLFLEIFYLLSYYRVKDKKLLVFHRRREHYVECDAREMPEEKRELTSHFPCGTSLHADKAGSVLKLHQDKNKFTCNKKAYQSVF